MSKYNKIAILFHWTIAILIVANILLATLAEDLPRAGRAVYMNPHKVIGISILILTVGRILWRLGHRPPTLPGQLAGLQATAGRTVHVLFYILIVLMPLTGWLMIGANGKAAPVDFFGLFTADLAVGKKRSARRGRAQWTRISCHPADHSDRIARFGCIEASIY